jgi:hypothetical protein
MAAIWLVRTPLAGLRKAISPLVDFTQTGSGFEWINKQITNLTTGASSVLSLTQTGILNWNVVGIVGGLILLLSILLWGGLR